MSEHKEFISDIMNLHNVASKLDGWNKSGNQKFIEVQEYALALDGIAFAYLSNNKPMMPDQFEIFERLAADMELEKDPEYDAVARLRARDRLRLA